MWKPIDSRKGEDDHCWMKAIHCLSTPSEPPLRPSYWLFRVVTLSLHISCSNIVGCADWLEKTRLHCWVKRQTNYYWIFMMYTTWYLLQLFALTISILHISIIQNYVCTFIICAIWSRSEDTTHQINHVDLEGGKVSN